MTVLTVQVCYDLIITGEQKHLFSRRRRSKVSLAPSGNTHFTHAAFSGSARACRPVCAFVLFSPQRIHRHLRTVSRKSAVGPPAERERAAAGDDSLHKTQLVKQCCWAWQGRPAEGVRVNKSERRLRASFYSTIQYVLLFLKKKCKNWEKPSSPGTSTPLVEILLIYIYYILIFTISAYIYNTKEWNNKCILLCFHSTKVMNRFQWNCQEMLIMGQRTRGYILVMFRILEGLWSFKDHQPTSKAKGLWS